MTLHLPTLLVAAIATMMMSSALMTLFGRTQRIYRGFWWWTAAQWMGTAGLALQLLRNAQPELLPLSNLLLMQWPIVTLIGVRRFYPRQVLPVPPLADVLLLAFAYLLWAATWAAGGDVAARVSAFGIGACVLFAYSAAITALLVHLGVLDAAHPVVGRLLNDPMKNWRGIEVGGLRLAPGFTV